MKSEDQKALDSETHRSLGRFVMAFSGLLYALETSTVQLIAPFCDGKQMILLNAAVSEKTAGPLVSSFFSVFYERWEDQITNDDDTILKCLRRELEELVRERNRLMHDVWMSKTVGGDPGPHPLSRHRVRAHGKGVDFEDRSYKPDDLDRLADDAGRLSSIVNGSVWYMRSGQVGPELHRRMYVQEGKVFRKKDEES